MKKMLAVVATGLLVAALTLTAFGVGLFGSGSAQAGEGGRVQLSATPDPLAHAAGALENAGPRFVRCALETKACVPVEPSAVRSLVDQGERVYARTVYQGITDDVIARGIPLFTRDELVCADASNVTGCKRAGDVTPTIRRGQPLYVTYLPLETRVVDGKTIWFRAAGEIPLKWTD
jgi:hypothetical protein